MSTEQKLEEYLLTHPEYWDFEDEVEEVKRLKSLIEQESAFTRGRAREIQRVKARIGIAS